MERNRCLQRADYPYVSWMIKMESMSCPLKVVLSTTESVLKNLLGVEAYTANSENKRS